MKRGIKRLIQAVPVLFIVLASSYYVVANHSEIVEEYVCTRKGNPSGSLDGRMRLAEPRWWARPWAIELNGLKSEGNASFVAKAFPRSHFPYLGKYGEGKFANIISFDPDRYFRFGRALGDIDVEVRDIQFIGVCVAISD